MARMSLNAIQTTLEVYELCSGSHTTHECQVGNLFAQSDQVNFTNNFQQAQKSFYDNQFQNACNQNWNMNQNPSMGQMNNNIQNPSQYSELQPKKPSVEDLLVSFKDKINKKIESNEHVLKMRIE